MFEWSRHSLAAVILLSSETVSADVASCPCYGEADVHIVDHARSCFLVFVNSSSAPVTWHEAIASEHGASSSCMQHYRLAAPIDPHLTMIVANKLKQEANVTAGSRLRVALAANGADSTWHWIADTQHNFSANHTNQHFILWRGEGHKVEPELHTSAVMDVDSGQMVTASIDEPLAALWMTTPQRVATDFECKQTVIGASVHADVDITLNTHLPKRHCPIECHINAHCRAFSIVPVDATSYNCVLHTAYSSESIHIRSNVEGGTFCMKFKEASLKSCSPLSFGEHATVTYSSTAISLSTPNYKDGTVATISCNNGTYFYHNKETQVQVACDGDTALWLHWHPATYMCIRLSKLWLWHAFLAKWQEWQPGALAVDVPQGSDIATMLQAEAQDAIAAYYSGYFYVTMSSVGHVYKVDPATRSVSRQPEIAAEYQRKYAAGALVPGGRLLVCGGFTTKAEDTCFLHGLTTGVTQRSTSILGVGYVHSMCYYRYRVYVIGGYNGTDTLWDVQSTDAASPGAWRAEAHMAERRHTIGHGLAVFRGLMYVCGGHEANVGDSGTCEFFNGTGWTTQPMQRAARGGSLNALDDATMYYAGGDAGAVKQATVVAFNGTTQLWADEQLGLLTAVTRHCAIEVW